MDVPTKLLSPETRAALLALAESLLRQSGTQRWDPDDVAADAQMALFAEWQESPDRAVHHLLAPRSLRRAVQTQIMQARRHAQRHRDLLNPAFVEDQSAADTHTERHLALAAQRRALRRLLREMRPRPTSMQLEVYRRRMAGATWEAIALAIGKPVWATRNAYDRLHTRVLREVEGQQRRARRGRPPNSA